MHECMQMIYKFKCRTWKFRHALISQTSSSCTFGSQHRNVIPKVMGCVGVPPLLFTQAEPWGACPQSCSFSLIRPLSLPRLWLPSQLIATLCLCSLVAASTDVHFHIWQTHPWFCSGQPYPDFASLWRLLKVFRASWIFLTQGKLLISLAPGICENRLSVWICPSLTWTPWGWNKSYFFW